MEKEFNKIIIEIIIEFVKKHNLLADKPYLSLSNNQRKYIFGSQNYGSSLDSIYKDIIKFDIFASISSFNYYGKNYLIQFNQEFNNKIFTVFLDKFLNTSFESLFYTTITKIVPINFCIQNQPWDIVKNFLCIQPRKSNGLPSIPDMKEFFQHLLNYKNEPDFQKCLLKFCQLNTSFIKRIEAKEYLKNLLCFIDISEDFSSFLIHNKEKLTVEKKDFVTFYINKKVLFTHVSDIAINKKQTVTTLNNIFSTINKDIPDYTKIEQVFIHQDDEKFSELIILVRFSEAIDYCFESYYLFLLKFFLTNKFEIYKNLPSVSRNFFLNIKYPEKTKEKKQKTTKI